MKRERHGKGICAGDQMQDNSSLEENTKDASLEASFYLL